MKRRIAIVFDGHRWHVRRIRVIERDLERDETVYRCDKPIANDLPNVIEAVRRVRPSWVPALLEIRHAAEKVLRLLGRASEREESRQ